MLSCNVKECQRPAVVKEIYLGPGGSGKIEDAVCSWHTGRFHRLHMIGKEPVPGEVAYQMAEGEA